MWEPNWILRFQHRSFAFITFTFPFSLWHCNIWAKTKITSRFFRYKLTISKRSYQRVNSLRCHITWLWAPHEIMSIYQNLKWNILRLSFKRNSQMTPNQHDAKVALSVWNLPRRFANQNKLCNLKFYSFFVNDEINDQSPDDKLSFKDN